MTEFTVGAVPVTPVASTWAVRWLKGRAGAARLGPGSKKPEPETAVPVTVVSTEGTRAATSVAADGVAGGGARSLTTWQP